MALLLNPEHRLFPALYREKVIFLSHDPAVKIAPLYIYIDNFGRWNIDTFWLLEQMRERMNDMFANLYSQHFHVLTVEKILEAAQYGIANQMQYAVLVGDLHHPQILMRYYDLEATYSIPGKRLSSHRIPTEAIFEDMIKDIPGT